MQRRQKPLADLEEFFLFIDDRDNPDLADAVGFLGQFQILCQLRDDTALEHCNDAF